MCFYLWELRRGCYLMGFGSERRASLRGGPDPSGSVGTPVLSDRPAPWGPTFPYGLKPTGPKGLFPWCHRKGTW